MSTISSRLKTWLGVAELRTTGLWKAALAEFLGTAFLVLFACGQNEGTRTSISLVFGLAVATLVQCICHVSGGHINPAVTFGLLAACKVSIIRALIYVVVQTLGAITGSGLEYVLNGDYPHSGGIVGLNPLLDPLHGFGIELLISFVLVFTVCAVCDPNRTDIKGSVPLAIGFAISTCHYYAVPYTGAGMNPARAIGPAIVYNFWENHWLYWVGPIIGGVAAGLLYQFVFSAPQCPLVLVEDRPLITMRRSPAKEPQETNTALL